MRDLKRMRETRGDFRIEFTDVTSGYAIIGLAGAQSRKVLQATTNTPVPDLKRFQFAPVEIGLASGWAGRLSFTGEDGYELYIPSEMAMAAHEALVAAGASHAGLYASGSLRIESSFRAFGHELRPAPHRSRREWVRYGVWFRVCRRGRLKDHQPTRRIVSFLFDTPDAIPIHDEPIYFDGRVVGQITSAAWSYRFIDPLPLAWSRLRWIGFSPKPSLKALK